jgi:Concanavalin A-like lectin/glucanases superfamily
VTPADEDPGELPADPSDPGTPADPGMPPDPVFVPGVPFSYSALAVRDGQLARTTDVVTSQVSSLTLEAWVRWDGGNERQILLYNGTPSLSGYGLALENGALRALAGSGVIACASCQLTPGTWTHVAAALFGAQWHLFKDGVEGTTSITGPAVPITPTGSFTIGGPATSDGTSGGLTGAIDEVRVWTTARSREQILTSRNTVLRGDERDLAAYYRLDEGLGAIANDASGHGHPAALIGSPTMPIWTSSGASLPIGLARSAVKNAELRSPIIATAAVDNLTVEAWVRWDGDPALQAVLYNGDSSRSGYGLYVQNGKPRVLVGGKGWFVCTTCQLTAGAWTHLAATRSGATWSIFVNGQLAQSSTAALVPSVPSGTFSVASGSDGADRLLGAIDEVRLWTTARSASDLAGAAAISLSGNEPQLVRYFRFDEGVGTFTADASGSFQLAMNGGAWMTSMVRLTSVAR